MQIRIVTKLLKSWECTVCQKYIEKRSQAKTFYTSFEGQEKKQYVVCLQHPNQEIEDFVENKRKRPRGSYRQPRSLHVLGASAEELKDIVERALY